MHANIIQELFEYHFVQINIKASYHFLNAFNLNTDAINSELSIL